MAPSDHRELRYLVSDGLYNERVSAAHYLFFHGEVSRTIPWERFGDLPQTACIGEPPLRLWRSGRVIPPITMPMLNLVVDETVAARLRDLPHVELKPVLVERLTNEYFHPGDNSWEDVPRITAALRNKQPERIVLEGPPATDDRIPVLYELIAPTLEDVNDASGNEFEECLLTLGREKRERTQYRIQVGRAVGSEFPIVYARAELSISLTLFSANVLSRLEDFVDREFFSWGPVECTAAALLEDDESFLTECGLANVDKEARKIAIAIRRELQKYVTTGKSVEATSYVDSAAPANSEGDIDVAALCDSMSKITGCDLTKEDLAYVSSPASVQMTVRELIHDLLARRNLR